MMNNYSFVLLSFVLLLIVFTPSSFAQRMGVADLVLSDVYLEPADPKPGDFVNIQSIIYNAGLDSTTSVTNVVTVGYFIDGNLVKIAELPNINPGVENGLIISSGPIWVASEGSHTLTVVLNYHDTLSHLTDRSSNNILQRIFSIGEPIPSIVLFEVFQKYVPETNMQQIRIDGNLESLHNSFFPDEVSLQIGDLHDTSIVDERGLFSFIQKIPVSDKIIPVTITVEENYPLLGSSSDSYIYPVNLDADSVLSFNIQNPSEFLNFKNSSTVIVIYDEFYELIKKINTDTLLSSEKTDDVIFTTLPAGTYIVEIYFEGRFFTAIKTDLKENSVNTNTILIPENSKIRFHVLDDNGDPMRDVMIENWRSILHTDDDGFTNWVEVLPTLGDREPYVPKVILPNGEVFWSDSFFIGYGEQKIIQMVIE